MRSAILGLAFVSALGGVAAAHPGRTDANGGHHDRKNGGYHYHGGGVSLPEPRATIRIEPRTTARTSARTTARQSPLLTQPLDRVQEEARLAAEKLAAEKAAADAAEALAAANVAANRLATERADIERREKDLADKEARLREIEAKQQAELEEFRRAKYRLHMSIGAAKLIADYKDQGSTYYVTTINGGHVGYPKVMIKKIEAIEHAGEPAR
jgi:hypothetical protein